MNHKITKISNDSEIIKSINRSLELLKSGNLEDAVLSFETVLKCRYSDLTAESGIKCAKYWIPRMNKFNVMKNGYEKGKALIEEWKKFENFILSLRNIQQKVITQLMYFVYNEALYSFKDDLNENKIIDIETLFLVADSYKKIGDYKNAIKYFEEILSLDKSNSNTMALLADCYALIDETKRAKVIFREAFFIDPSSINLDSLESELIKMIIEKTKEILHNDIDLNYWIPIYGRALNILNIYRELLPIEYGKIKKEIFYLEKKYYEETVKDLFFTARLLNCYFWVYDYNLIKNSDKKELTEIEGKIKEISEDIYSIFVKNQNYHTGD
jgi:tetratricopeptide (TPR) repeat protein